MTQPPRRVGKKAPAGLSIDVPEPVAVASPSLNNHSASLDFVVKGLSIGKNGLTVDGKQASNIAHLDDLVDLPEVLGQGSFGIVRKVQHKPTGTIYAKKTMPLDITEEFHEKKLLELKTLHAASHENIVSFYGAFYSEGVISFVLEYMDGGTLASLVEACGGKLPETVLGKLTAQLLQGLSYLHKSMHIIHRDIKPQNILLNSKGQAKITDFGVSGELASTQAMAKSFVGTHKYMSPTRITGKQHSAKSDVWSLGLVVLEAALGHFPYGSGDPAKTTFFALLMEIVNKPAPQLPSDQFSPEFVQFISDCLQKEETNRPDSTALLQHPFILKYANDPLDLADWIKNHITTPKK